jgi:hypothetical protein
MTRDHFQEGQELVVTQTSEWQALDPGLPVQGGQRSRQRVVHTHVGIPEGADHQHGKRSTAREDMPEQLHGAGVRPMEVIEEHEKWDHPRDALEEVDDGSEESWAIRFLRGGLVGRLANGSSPHGGHDEADDSSVRRHVLSDQVDGGLFDEVS